MAPEWWKDLPTPRLTRPEIQVSPILALMVRREMLRARLAVEHNRLKTVEEWTIWELNQVVEHHPPKELKGGL